MLVRFVLALGLLCCLATHRTCLAEEQAPEFRLNERTVISFASVEEAKPVMTARDEFIAGLSRFDLECRLRSNQQLSIEQLLEYIPSQLREWSDDEKSRLIPVLEKVRERLSAWSLPWPEKIYLIKSTGHEDAGAAYCRGAGIVLPQTFIDHADERVMLHELFHILSSHNPDLRRDLYAIVGFTIGPDVKLPESLQPIKLSNPDAPRLNCYIELTHNGQLITATPLLTANAEHFEPQPGRTLFNYLQFQLLVVEQQGDEWRAKLDDASQPILLDPNSVDSYFDQIGRNTQYIIHPEEVLADNFVLLMRGELAVATPQIPLKMAEILPRKTE